MSLIQNTNRRANASSAAASCAAAAGASCSGSWSGWRGTELSSGTLSLRIGFGS